MSILRIKNLSKTYSNGVKALANVNLELHNGMFGLLGPNGAGKSSLMRTLATLQEADTGSITLDDINIIEQPAKLREVLGYLPQEFGVYSRITAQQLLHHIATLKGFTQASERKEMVAYLLDKVNLYEKRNKSVKKFSGGMKQRFGIAQALIGNPKLLIVDEPTAGLDPTERNRFYNLLADVSSEVIVILSTHIVEDVKELCTDMAIMNLGKVIYQGTPSKAVEELQGKIYQKKIARSELQTYSQDHNIIATRMIEGHLHIFTHSDTRPGQNFEVASPNLEDVFFLKINRSKSTS
ncbi:ABC transporter ATP-binding protein [Spongiimicrobium salis]|uniref:ABC transporter ATP-binding protein n=1 Tax=Spongiimicrobium salis TaxID=1667022 RepID=UPI00374DE2D7